MAHNTIKIYARLKGERPSQNILYNKICKQNQEIITFHGRRDNGFYLSKSAALSFGFKKVFDERSNQEQVFNAIAKPIIERVLDGFNGTIFAYGQTGSGKTYTITGSSTYFEERGIIPRSIEEIFGFVRKNPYMYTIYISYLEIYNDVAYDLLKSPAKYNMELCQKDYYKEKIRRHNVKTVRVCSEEEAMMLLLVGDSNRITVETARNLNSSRSHCIFTMNIISKISKKGQTMNSKLNLIDLAGSERIYKSNISGLTLKEAKCINLSLHYLQDVVRILCQKNSYVPFRNSLLTYMLKDSLGGNCVTVLLATLDLNKNNFEETISTCRFAQNVGQVSVETEANKIISPKEEITHLKNIIEDLQSELSSVATFKHAGPLSETEIEKCKVVVKSYLNNPNDELHLAELDMRSIRYCFKFFKQIIQQFESHKLKTEKQDEEQNMAIKEYEEVVKYQEQQIGQLNSLLYNGEKSLIAIQKVEPRSHIHCSQNNFMDPYSKSLFKKFLCISKNKTELNYYTDSIDSILKQAKHVVSVVQQCQKNILAAQEHLTYDPPNLQQVVEKILNEQVLYKVSLAKLEQLKFQTARLKTSLSMAMEKMASDFNSWYQQRKDQSQSSENDILQSYSLSSLNDVFSENSDGDKENLDLSVSSKKVKYSKLNAKKKDRDVLKEINATSSFCEVEVSDALEKSDIENADYPNIGQSTFVNFLPITNKEIMRESSVPVLTAPSELFTAVTDTRDYLQNENLSADSSNVFMRQTPERDFNVKPSKTVRGLVRNNLFIHDDPPEFKEFLSKIAFTGDQAVDEEIVNFYRTKFLYSNSS